jgi:5,10-methylenetetrahydromethanopterin reductase
MDFGINLATSADSWRVVKRAEVLGYSRAWFYDTQLLNADLFVAMGAAAVQTSRIRLGTGVLVPINRIAPVAASALASLNALAPGRIDFGISTGFTATRTMGLGPVPLADLEKYIGVVEKLLGGETTEWDFAGKRRKIRFLNPDVGAINISDPIPLYISAMGPRSRELTAALGANWMQVAGNQAAAIAGVADMHKAWRTAGVDPATQVSAALASGCVLRDGEPYDSPRARAQAGPHATILLHFLAEMDDPDLAVRLAPPPLAPLVERYLEIYRAYEPADARYLENHRGHLMFLRPEEQELCTAQLIQAATFTGQPTELRDRLRELRDAGHDHFAIRIAHGQPEMLEEWADVFEHV